MLNEEIQKFESLTGKNANDFSIAYVGGFLDGYDEGKAEAPALNSKGEWLEYNATGKKQYMCSKCGMKEKNPKIARYCYWCGAKMKGGNNDSK